jgi:1-acyl-sn-glycerol-3-phosphate acyltransferase
MIFPEPGPHIPRRGGALRAGLGKAILLLTGWRPGPLVPDLPRFVAIAAPHSSNWDFIIGIALVFALRLDIHYLGKAELFRGLLGRLMRWLGGIPVDRARPGAMVDQTIALFNSNERLIVALAPEGTRKPVTKWKTGFYRIAVGAGVPIVPAYFDVRNKIVGMGPPFYPTGDQEADIAALRGFYLPILRRDGLPTIIASGDPA